MSRIQLQVELFTEVEGFLVVRGHAFDHTTRGPASITFVDEPTGEPLSVLGPFWYSRPDVAEVHSLLDDRVGFRVMVATDWAPGRPPFEPERLGIAPAVAPRVQHALRRATKGAGHRVSSLLARAGSRGASDERRRAVDLFPLSLSKEDPIDRLSGGFLDGLRDLTEGAVLEIGSRARSGIVRRDCVAAGVEYVGLDVVDGPNVDVVGDAHRLSEFLPAAHFTHAFAISVWEHLLAPWKVSLELNAVLTDGAEVLVQTHQTWPVHDAPSDYWRFSQWSWKALFNEDTGFEIVESAMGIPGTVLAHMPRVGTVGLGAEPAFLGSTVLARKIGPPRVTWGAATDELGATFYPA
jgi:hypothetical protein